MLDTETKRKIDSARDILVGKIPDPTVQVDQITTALIYKFMDDMDKEAIADGGRAKFFSRDFKKFSWPKLIDKRLSGQERLDLYTQALSQFHQNKNFPPLFREIFKNAFLPYRDPETLSLFLKEIDGFSYDHSENLGNAFEHLLSILGSQGDAGQFRTPRHIIDFIVEVVGPQKDESILDPACGTGGFLISSYKHIIKCNSKNYDPKNAKHGFTSQSSSAFTVQIQSNGRYKGEQLKPLERQKLQRNIIGYDISPKMVKLSLVNMYLHRFREPKIYEYDTLTSEDRWADEFDVILANPPFMSPKGGIRPHNKFSVKANRSEVLFVDYIAEHLSLKGRAGIIVPEGIIFNKANRAYKSLRKMLIEERFLWAVVSLPEGVFKPYSGVKTSILFLDKKLAQAREEILFIDIQNDGFELGDTRRRIEQNDLPEAYQVLKLWSRHSKKQKTTLAHWVDRKKITQAHDWVLTGHQYKIGIHIELGNLEKNLKEVFDPLSKGLLSLHKNIESFKKTKEFKQLKSGLEHLGEELNRIVNSEDFLNVAKSIQTAVLNLKKSTLAQNLKSIMSDQNKLSKALKEQQKYPMVSLGDICKIFHGNRPKGGAVSSGVLSIGGEHINSDGSFNFSKPKYIPKKFFNEMKRGKLQPGDVLVVKDGATTGKTGYFDKTAPFKTGAVNEHVFILRPDIKQVDPFYIYQIMKSDKGNTEILKHKTGSAQGGINLSIKQIKIPLPSLEVQKKIVEEITGYQKIIDGAKQVIQNWKPIIPIDPSWPIVELEKILEKIKYTNKIKKTDFLKKGIFPIIDQSENFISGYWNNREDVFKVDRPIIVFGDHTCCFKYIDFNFVLGADGVKIIQPNKQFLPFFLYCLLLNTKIRNLGYSRHFKNLKKIKIPLPSLKKQKEIVSKIEEERAHIESCKKLIKLHKDKIHQRIDKIWKQK